MKKLIAILVLMLSSGSAYSQSLPNPRYGNSFRTPKESYVETFIGVGKSPERSRQDAHMSISAQQKTIRSVVWTESKKIAPDSYITVVRIKTY